MFEVLQLVGLGGRPEGWMVYMRGMDDVPEHYCSDEWNAVVAQVRDLPVFETPEQAVAAARKIDLHGYAPKPIEIYR